MPPKTSDEKLSVDKAVERFLKATALREQWFAPSFLGAIPFASMQPIRDKIATRLGAFQRLGGVASPFDAVYEKGHITVTAKLDAEGRFIALLLKPVLPAAKSMDEVLQAFKELPGKVSVLILEGGTTLGELEPDLALGVGSAFKLAAIAALRSQIDSKKRTWRDVVELSAKTRSLPSGFLQEWPDAAPLTLYSLAALMISRSDNTATDTIIDLVGRKNVESFAGRNRPYLMTREMFLLKSRGNEAFLERWRSGDEAARRVVLEELDSHALPQPKDYPSDPTALDVEWFFTGRELCALMQKVADLPMMSINPGIADRTAWDRGGQAAQTHFEKREALQRASKVDVIFFIRRRRPASRPLSWIAAAMQIRRRAVWGARLPKKLPLDQDWDFEVVVIHHSGGSGLKSPKALQDLDMDERGFDDVPYEYMVHPDGTIFEGRYLAYESAATAKINKGKLGILMMGNFQHDIRFSLDPLSKNQVIAATALINTLKGHFPLKTLGGHRNFKPDTECPGDTLIPLLPGLQGATGLAPP